MGIFRIHLTVPDLARTRLAAGADPLWEIVLSRFRLYERHGAPEFRCWARGVRADADRAARARPGAQALAVLAPHGPYFPDFLTPHAGGHGLAAGLDALMSTPRRRLRLELERLAEYGPLPGWVRPLADGDVEAITRLGDALRAYHDAVLAPDHDLARRVVDADRARRAHDFLTGGVEGVLAGLRPAVRWEPPVLEIDYSVDRELRLDGRGLLLVPSFYCQGTPVALADPSLTPVLVYPVAPDLRQPRTAGTRQRLQALLGRTRTAVLTAVNVGATTTQLSSCLAISPASVSRHTSVLREAGLIATHRRGSAVVHSLTPLGVRMVEQDHGATR
jgi:DNA-binding transcriptional ArsR family regulator